MTNPQLRTVAPATENGTVITRRRKNADLRTREHLTADEVERLIDAAKGNRHAHRDELMVLLTFRHGLRAVESATCAGSRSTSRRRYYMSVASRTARRPHIR